MLQEKVYDVIVPTVAGMKYRRPALTIAQFQTCWLCEHPLHQDGDDLDMAY